MPAPGNDSVPNGRSPLDCEYEEAESDEDGAGNVVGAQVSRASLSRSRRRHQSSTLPIGTHRVLDARGVGIPERLELGLVEIGELLAEILDRRS